MGAMLFPMFQALIFDVDGTLSDLGEPGRPSIVRGGPLHGKAFVDLGLLRTWHREAISKS